jgi:gelsolin
MSGMQKVGTGAKLEDSNIANYGSKEHKDAKLAAAKTEKAWEGAGKKVGVEVWRIEKFKVKRIPESSYGSFFRGDSYIILNTYKPDPESDKLAYNVHFWLGAETTQDEAGTAAYKTVELDDLLGDLPVQYREVDGNESEIFLDVFEGKIQVMDGGIESGFNKVKPEEYKPRLFHVKGTKKVKVTEVKCSRDSLNVGDTFLLDNGLEIIQWNGPSAGMFEKRKAMELINQIKDDRNGKPKSIVLDGLEDHDTFWSTLGSTKPEKEDELAPATSDNVKVEAKKEMHEVSDKTGELKMTKVDFGKGSLKTEEVFIVDMGSVVYCWVGKGASKDERANGLKFANDYLVSNKMPFSTPIIRVMEGAEPSSFKKAVGM